MRNKNKPANLGHLQLVGLGANLSSTSASLEQTLQRAVFEMARSGLVIRSVSRFFSSPCFPVGAGPDYINAAIALKPTLPADELLKTFHRIEADFGRERKQRWGQRTLDLDLLASDNSVLPDAFGFQEWFALDPSKQAEVAPDQLVLPHPRMHERAFVLVPLNDIARDWRHPVLGKTVGELLLECSAEDVAQVLPV